MSKAKNTKEQSYKIAKTYSVDGKKQGLTNLSDSLFSAPVNKQLLAQAVHVYKARQIQQRRAAKSRGEVVGSTRKIYRQKGTGRARHGDLKAPIFVGGGVAHGPKPYGKKPVLSKRMRRRALLAALTSKAAGGTVAIVKEVETLPAKTQKLASLLKTIGVDVSNESVLFITAQKQDNVILAGRNIPNLSVMSALLVNAYDVLKHRRLVLEEKALYILEKTFLQSSDEEIIKDKKRPETHSKKKNKIQQPKKKRPISKKATEKKK